jgi:hypothetical protein
MDIRKLRAARKCPNNVETCWSDVSFGRVLWKKNFVIRPSANGDQVELSGSYWQKRGNFHPIFLRALHFCIYKFIKHKKYIESFLKPSGAPHQTTLLLAFLSLLQ